MPLRASSGLSLPPVHSSLPLCLRCGVRPAALCCWARNPEEVNWTCSSSFSTILLFLESFGRHCTVCAPLHVPFSTVNSFLHAMHTDKTKFALGPVSVRSTGKEFCSLIVAADTERFGGYCCLLLDSATFAEAK